MRRMPMSQWRTLVWRGLKGWGVLALGIFMPLWEVISKAGQM